MDRAIGFDLHTHAAVRGLPADPVSYMTGRGFIHSRDAFHLTRRECGDAGDDFVGHSN
jgi:hypothetical protein